MARLRLYARPAAIVIAGLLLGWLVLASTVDRYFARRAPALALAWNRGSADANVRLAETLFQSGDPRQVAPQATTLATRSFLRQPINPGAVRLLAIGAAVRGDAPRSERLSRMAELMSRRDLPTQMSLIETAVQRGDIETALIHYDRALRTNGEAQAVLFPILTGAAADPAVWRPLSAILARRPQWWRPFVEQFVSRSSSADALYTIARRTRIERPRSADPALLQAIEKRLVDLGAYRAAADLFDRAHGQVGSGISPLRNGGFEQPGGWDPFEWNLQDTPDLAAIRQPSPRQADGSALFITATNGRGGDVATQLVILPPGRYRFTATVGGVSGDPLAFPHLVVRCARDARTLLDQPFPPSPDNGRRWAVDFAVPDKCSAQRVVIRAGSSLDTSDAAPWADNLAIEREGR